MPYTRDTQPKLSTGDELTANMVGIGMLFAAEAAPEADIEDTLISASVEGMERKQIRVLAILITWIGAHADRINADRLIRSVEHIDSPRVQAFWAGIAHWQQKDRRFARLMKIHRGTRVDVLPFGNEFHLRRRGEDPRFEGGPLRVPAGNLRDRVADVMTPEELARSHNAYRWRVIMGSSYRADLWAVLEKKQDLTAFALAKQVRCSFETARQVKGEWQIARAAAA